MDAATAGTAKYVKDAKALASAAGRAVQAGTKGAQLVKASKVATAAKGLAWSADFKDKLNQVKDAAKGLRKLKKGFSWLNPC